MKITHDAILSRQFVPNVCLDGLDANLIDQLHFAMLRLRKIEVALIDEYHPADEIRCPVHFCVGQEAVSASLSTLFRPDDYMFSHHRSHGYYFAKGAPTRALFAELYGKETGADGGKAGSQDISYADSRFFSGAILAGAVTIGVGTAFAESLRGSKNIVVTGFGEACTEEGVFYEGVNFAVVHKLPIVLMCENNRYSTFSPQLHRQAADNIHERVAAFGMRSKAIFGNDVACVYKTVSEAFADARAGKGPTFIESYTQRWNGHVGPGDDSAVGYRTPEELEFWKGLCPIKLLEGALKKADKFDEAKVKEWEKRIDAEIADAFHFAKTSPFPKNADWAALNYAQTTPLADKLLDDLEGGAFNSYQAEAIPGPY